MARPAMLLTMSLAACGPAAHGGLSNAPSAMHASGPEDRGEDAIANGDKSCPPSGKPVDDPLPGRRPRCAEAGPVSSSAPQRR